MPVIEINVSDFEQAKLKAEADFLHTTIERLVVMKAMESLKKGAKSTCLANKVN